MIDFSANAWKDNIVRGKSGNVLLIVLMLIGVVAASVGGYFWWSSKTSAPDKTVEAKPTDTSKGWKSYVDNTNKFTLKYPPNWTLQKRDPNVGMVFRSSETTETFEIEYSIVGPYGTSEKLPIPERIEGWKNYHYVSTSFSTDGAKQISKGDFFVDKRQATKYIFRLLENGSSVKQFISWIFIPNGNRITRLGLNWRDNSETVDQILSTFKFIDQSSTENWKTYKFTDYPLTFKYPGDLELQEKVQEFSNPPRKYIEISKNGSLLKIFPDQPGIGFENPDQEVTNNPLIVDGKQVFINNKLINKTRLLTKSNGQIGFLVLIPYPSQKTMVMASYFFQKGVVDEKLNTIFDQILLSFKFNN